MMSTPSLLPSASVRSPTWTAGVLYHAARRKDETGNVSGSHRGRHLMGLLIHLDIIERLGLTAGNSPDLAIASCGNAALAAAVLARASGRRLNVFVPTDADAVVVQRLKSLGCHLLECPASRERQAGDGAALWGCQNSAFP